MPPLRDDELLDAYKAVLAQWRFAGYVVFDPRPAEWIRESLSNYSPIDVRRMMYEHRDAVDQTKETREEHKDCYSHHYDFRLQIDNIRVYLETVFDYDDGDPEDSTIRVVQAKPA
jgi:hypothetical protein